MLLNLSNHPSTKWSEIQKNAAITQYDNIFDMEFPNIDPEWDNNKVLELAKSYVLKCLELKSKQNLKAVHLMGELTFCTALSILLKKHNINCIVSTTHRIVSFNKQGIKESEFSFCRFREYIIP